MLNKLLQKIAVLTEREKRLMIATLFIAVLSSWYALFYAPIMEEQAEVKEQLKELETQLAAQQQTHKLLQNHHASDLNLTKKNQLLALKAEYRLLEEQTQVLDKQFVRPELMTKMLSDLLKQNNQLTLIKLETLPVKQQQLLYQHGLVLQFSGNYLATLNYLKSLEAMPWNFIWDSIDYEVKDYPTAEITLRVHTLSLEKSWLNV